MRASYSKPGERRSNSEEKPNLRLRRASAAAYVEMEQSSLCADPALPAIGVFVFPETSSPAESRYHRSPEPKKRECRAIVNSL
jgi:hypothetical protein